VIWTGATAALQSVIAVDVELADGLVEGDADGEADGLADGLADGFTVGEAVGDALGDGEAAITTVAPKASAATAATPASLRMVLILSIVRPARCEASWPHPRPGRLNAR